MTKANTQVIAKAAAIIAGAGLVLSSFALAIPAGAQTTTTTTTTTSASVTFARDLTIGSTGADVTALQTWLISKGFSIPAGATGYFGTQTQAAVAAYQAANGITPPAGYFGPITRAKVNAGGGVSTGGSTVPGCMPGAAFSSTTGAPCTGGSTGGTSTGGLSGGEADLTNFDINDEDSSGAENEQDVELASIEFDVEDGDVSVQRVEFIASSTNSSLEENVWDYFDELRLVDENGDEVASFDAGDRDAWDEEDGDGHDIYRAVFLDVDTTVRENDTAKFTLVGDIANNIDTADLVQEFDFYVPDEGIRAVDGEGIQHYIPSSDSAAVTFGFDAEETGDLDINSSSDDPDNLTLISDADNDVEIDDPVFVFNLENNDSVDTLVTDITIDVATSTGDSIDSLITDATLTIDGDDFDGDINDDGTIDFTDIDTVIDGDSDVDVELHITVAEDADGTVDFSVDGNNITAESDETGDDSTVSGSTSSETHTIALTGVSVAGVSKSSDTNDAGTIGTFELTFEVTAEGDDDVYIYNGASQTGTTAFEFPAATASTTGVSYVIYQGGTASTTDFTADSALLTSGADTTGSYFVVESGQTEEFTLTVTIDTASPTATALYYVELDAIRFDDENDTTVGSFNDTVYTVPDQAEFQTSAESVANA